MAGFFSSSKLASATGKQRSCYQCGLIKGCETPKMPCSGKGEKGIFILGDFPTKQADRKGTQLVGQEKRVLSSALKRSGVDLERDCCLMNAVNCGLGLEEFPNDLQIEACRRSIQTEYKKNKPRLILLMGDFAIKSHWGHRWKNEINSVHNWRGWDIPDHYFNAWTAPIYHPSKLTDGKNSAALIKVWENDLKKAVEHIDEPIPEKIDEDCVDVIRQESHAIAYMKDLWNDDPEYFSFDYETTGLKPYFKGHDIACIGIATERGDAVSFMFTDKLKYEVKRYLARSRSKKIAQNMKFEDMWTRKILGCRVKNWFFDTMLASHLLDNRPGITGLKFQSFVRFGVLDYDSEISPFLKSVETDKGANGINRVFKAPRHGLLCYCGMDSLLTLRLADVQRREMGIGGIL